MKTPLVLVGAMLLACLGGCITHASSDYEVRHTNHLWQIDREATDELLRDRSPEGEELPPGVTRVGTGLDQVKLELISDGTYILHLLGSDQLIESQGRWRHSSSDSGTIVRLDPRGSRVGIDETSMHIRSWSIHIDGSGKRAIIRSMDEPDIALERIH